MVVSTGVSFKKFKRREFSYKEERGYLKIIKSFNAGFDVEFNGQKIFLLNDNIFYLFQNGSFEKDGVFSEECILIKDGDIIKALPINSELAFNVLNSKKSLKIDLEKNTKYLIKTNINLQEKEMIFLGVYCEGVVNLHAVEGVPEDSITEENIGEIYFNGGRKAYCFFDLSEKVIKRFFTKGKDFEMVSILGKAMIEDLEDIFLTEDIYYYKESLKRAWTRNYFPYREEFVEGRASCFDHRRNHLGKENKRIYFEGYQRACKIKRAAQTA